MSGSLSEEEAKKMRNKLESDSSFSSAVGDALALEEGVRRLNSQRLDDVYAKYQRRVWLKRLLYFVLFAAVAIAAYLFLRADDTKPDVPSTTDEFIAAQLEEIRTEGDWIVSGNSWMIAFDEGEFDRALIEAEQEAQELERFQGNLEGFDELSYILAWLHLNSAQGSTSRAIELLEGNKKPERYQALIIAYFQLGDYEKSKNLYLQHPDIELPIEIERQLTD
jgi:hypothetical protein